MDEVRSELEIALEVLGVVCTLTVDNGKELYAHKALTERVGVPVFFTHPYCSTERGAIENQEHLDTIASSLNHRPRACLGYLTPHEVQTKDNHLCTLPSQRRRRAESS